jgi:broad specificity phosphatase PhoE
MAVVQFVTHPEVVIDPAVPVPDWPLSEIGQRRMRVARQHPWLAGVRSVFCSAERKARDAAALLAETTGLRPTVIAALGENDRSATGFLPRAEFEAVADAFFAHPERSVRGWERAADAQRRIVGAVEEVLATAPAGDVAIIAHGGVGALLLCHLKNVPIDRTEDQPPGGGGFRYAFDRDSRAMLCGWRDIELP